MRTFAVPLWLLLSLTLTGAACQPAVEENSAPTTSEGVYEVGKPNRDGSGKVYMGREISWVMGHQGAGWLERDSRQSEERTDLLLENLPIEADSVIADIGAGTGYFSVPMARKAPMGRVFAVDIQPEMLNIIRERIQSEGISNIETILATETDPGLPANTVDLAMMVDVYHELSHPLEVMTELVASLKPGGLFVLIEYRLEDPRVPILRLHKMSEEQARREMQAVGLEWVETRDFLPQQHYMVFRRPEATARVD